MYLDITAVRHLEGYRLKIIFENGEEGVVDLKDYPSKGGVFSHLAEPDYFRQVFVNKDIGTLCWPGGLDIAPETLYWLAHGREGSG